MDRTPAPTPRAALRPYAAFGPVRYHPDGDQGGTTSPPPPVSPPPPPAAGDKGGKPEAKYSDADVDARIKAAVAEHERKATAKAEADRKAADEKRAAEQGEFQKLADQRKADLDKLAAENRTLRLSTALRDHLAEKHPEYVAVARYILPTIPADVDDAGRDRAIADAAAQYVKDNPRAAKGGAGGAPPAGPGRRVPPPATNGKANGAAAPRITGMAARW